MSDADRTPGREPRSIAASFIKICNVNVDIGLDSDLKSVDLDLGYLVLTTSLVLFVFVCSLRRYVFMKVLLLIQRTTCRNLIGKPPNCLRYSLFVFMVAIWNRADHYVFALWFLSFFA